MPTLKDKAVVLRLVDWSESSQIAVTLTREHGKVSATAKGAKRQTPSVMAKFSGGLELATRGEAVWIAKAGRDLGNLIEWNLLDGYWRLRRDLRAFDLAMYAVDLAHHLLHDHDPHPRSFDALARLLDQLGRTNGELAIGQADISSAALLAFQWALVDDAGYRPVLDRDAQSGAALDESATVRAFSAAAGGLVEGHADAWKVRQATVALLRRVAAGEDLSDAGAADVSRANRLLCAYCRAILDKQLPTMAAVLGRG